MPGCAALNCSNSTEKGYIMKRFPRDTVRRKQWLTKTRRGNWAPTNHSYLCEVHFAPEMWEKTRQDGSRKLKIDAVPTIFSFSNLREARKPPVARKLQSPKKGESKRPQELMPADFEINMFEDPKAQPSTSTSDLPTSESVTSKSTSREET